MRDNNSDNIELVTNGNGVIPPAILALIELPPLVLIQVNIHSTRGVTDGPVKKNVMKTKYKKMVIILYPKTLT